MTACPHRSLSRASDAPRFGPALSICGFLPGARHGSGLRGNVHFGRCPADWRPLAGGVGRHHGETAGTAADLTDDLPDGRSAGCDEHQTCKAHRKVEDDQMTANRGFTLGKKAWCWGWRCSEQRTWVSRPCSRPTPSRRHPGSGDADAATRAAPRHPGSQSRKFPRDVLHPHGSGRNDHLLQAGVTVKVATQDGEKLLTCGGPDWIVWRRP